MKNMRLLLDRNLADIPERDQFWDWIADESFDVLISSLRRQYCDSMADSELLGDEMLRVRAGCLALISHMQNMPRSRNTYRDELQKQQVEPDNPTVV